MVLDGESRDKPDLSRSLTNVDFRKDCVPRSGPAQAGCRQKATGNAVEKKCGKFVKKCLAMAAPGA
jgi:hypothetical protein